MKFPWDCPVDPMHQIFLGTGKLLSKLIASLAKGSLFQTAEKLLRLVKVLFDIKHRMKSLSEMSFWKAYDFKLPFFHIGPLIFQKIPIARSYFKSFCLLGLHGADSQLFNFHTMRHLCEQVRRIGHLWLFLLSVLNLQTMVCLAQYRAQLKTRVHC